MKTPTTPKTLVVIAFGIAALAATAGALAGSPGRHGDPVAMAEARLARMTEQFNLTPEQQLQIKTIIDEQQAAAERNHTETRQRIEGVLTDAQRAQQASWRQERMDRHLDRLTRRLNLSPDQAAQARAVMMERAGDPAFTRTELRERIAAVLTPEQRQEFAVKGLRDGRRGSRGNCVPRAGASKAPGAGRADPAF